MSVDVIELKDVEIITIKSIIKKVAIIFIALCTFVALYDWLIKDTVYSLFWFILGIIFYSGFFTLPTVLYIQFCLQQGVGFVKRNQIRCEEALQKLGYNIKYSGIGIFVDIEKQVFIFRAHHGNSKVLICNFSDVKSWHRETTQETTQYLNSDNAYAGSKTVTHFIHINVGLASHEHPVVRFIVRNNDEATLWMSRIDALVNSH